MSPPGPQMREDFPKLAESSKKDVGNNKIIEMLRSIRKIWKKGSRKGKNNRKSEKSS